MSSVDANGAVVLVGTTHHVPPHKKVAKVELKGAVMHVVVPSGSDAERLERGVPGVGELAVD